MRVEQTLRRASSRRAFGGLVLGLMVGAGTMASAQGDPRQGVVQAVQDCAAFVAAKSTEIFPEPGFEMAGDILFETTQDRPASGLALKFTHFIPATPEGSGSAAPPHLWQCNVTGSRLSRPIWLAADIRGLFSDATAILPTLEVRKAEDENWQYEDCADPAAPVDYAFGLSKVGHLYVQVTAPTLDAFSCRDLIEVDRLFYACVYAFAKEPWEKIREASGEASVPGQFTLHHDETLDDLVGFAPGTDGTRRGTVETEVGPVEVALTGVAPTTECRVEGTASEEVLNDWLVSASIFYDGGFFRFDGGRGVYTCAPSFPSVAMFLEERPLDGGAVAFALTMDTGDYPTLREMCAG
ncbi:hypothetical protein [Jannaschia pohangensis]|uniref:Uncharacterized protein n=1 Tax=Jannaschia pohangensis TaxID=390807 RepID=A0A1I3NPT1_9RHOB|nr:hypothetical protein [Jannaschia pohangensis]SFJ11117.1 hypothetical protein SAMN04488095_2212 [Jannaschia pohangensis]